MRRSAAPALLLLALLLGWEGAAHWFRVPRFILPAPSDIAAALWQYRRELGLVHLPVTLAESVVGLALSVALGVAIAVAMLASRTVERALYPLVVASQTIPIVAISPVFLLWFGYSLTQKVAVVVLISFFPVAVSTFDGLRAADPELLDLLRTMGASRRDVFRKVQLPAALPQFFSGTRVAATVSVVGATIGEWLGGSAGLGYFGRRMASTLRSPPLFASVVLLSLLGVVLFLAISWLERQLLPWYRRQNMEE